MTTGPLERLFDPASVAVIGASNDPSKWGHQYSAKLLKARDRRAVYLVNQKRSPVLGEATYGSLADLPETPEVAVLSVPRGAVLDQVAAAAERGVKYLICVTAGFAETGAEGRALQDKIVGVARAGGVRLVGPNCLGVVDTHARFECNAFWDVPPGSVALLSQSGGVLLEIGERLAQSGLGISRGVSVGNQADLAIHEYLDAVIADPNSAAVVVYVEEFKQGRLLLEGAGRVIDAGKPVLVLAVRATEAVSRAMSSHTGSMISADAVVDAACAAAGVIRVSTTVELITALRGVLAKPRPRGRRTAVVADGGGAAVLGAGAATAAGLVLPRFSDRLIEAIRPLCGPGSGLTNPVDYVGALDIEAFMPVCSAIAASGEVDAMILTGLLNNVRPDPQAAREREIGSLFAAQVAAGEIALSAGTPLTREPATMALQHNGVPVFDSVDLAARSLFLSAEAGRRRLPPLPAAQPPLRARPDYLEARRLIAAVGITFPPAERAMTLAEALAAAGRIGYPVALKALGLDHKSDCGGVALNLASAEALSAAFEEMTQRLRPPSVSVEGMVDGRGGVEVLVGAVADPAFGPMLAVGLGGVFTELVQDTAMEPAPVDEVGAEALLRSLRGSRVFDGYRGRPPVELGALARSVAAFSRFVASHPEIAEAEMNPIIALGDRSVAVDARIALR